MPTKRNSAGQQQPYVPAGHGDASGEYGEHTTGSNVHYASPDDVKKQLGYTPEQPKASEIPKEIENKLNGTKTKTEKLKDILGASFLAQNKNIMNNLEGLDEDGVDIVVSSLLNGGFELEEVKGQTVNNHNISENLYYKGTVYLTKNANIDNFFHESGHALDAFLGEKLGLNDLSNSFVSSKYKTTMGEMLRQETRKLDISNLEAKINEEKNAHISNELKKMNMSLDEINEINKIIREKIDDYKITKYGKTFEDLEDKQKKLEVGFFINHEISREEYYKQRENLKNEMEKTNNQVIFEISQMFNKEKNRISEIRIAEARITDDYYKKRIKKYGDLSDVISGATRNPDGLIGVGHPGNYWSKSKILREHEFFAEAFDGKTANKESYETLKEYFPKTIEIFEEALSKGVEKWK